MIPCEFEYVRPESLEDALAVLQQRQGDCQVIAGGQSLMPLLKLRFTQPSFIVDISRIPSLSTLALNRKTLEIGAMVTERTIELSSEVASACPMLCDTVKVIADPHIRNLGTIGGSLCFADPRGDLPASLLALGAELSAASVRGSRVIPIEEFFVGPFTTALEPDEMLINISVPLDTAATGSYVKLSKRAGDFAVIAAAANLSWDRKGKCSGARVALCAAGPVPVLVGGIDGVLVGSRLEDDVIEKAARHAMDTVEPFEDPLVSPEYRTAMIHTMTAKALRLARDRARA